MRAWVIESEGAMRLKETETPHPGPWDVRVRVEAIGINRADLLQVKGLYPAPPGYPSEIPGLEYAGTVEAVGDKVGLHAVGDRVMGLVPGGAYAELVVTHEREAIRVPPALDSVQAAAVPEDFLTAYRALYLEGGLQPGQWALIRPCTAGVGLAAVQLVEALGGRSLGTSRSEQRLSIARQQGLRVALVDGDEPLPKRVREATDGEGAAVILDMLGGETLEDSLSSLRQEGTLVLIGLLAGTRGQVNLGTVLRRWLRIKAMTMRAQPPEQRMRVAQAFGDRLAPLFEDSRLKPVVSAVHAFEEAEAAHATMADNRHCGKIVLQLGKG